MTMRRRTLVLTAAATVGVLARADSAAADGAAEVLGRPTVWPLLLVMAVVPTAATIGLVARTSPDANRWPAAARLLSTVTLVVCVANVLRSLDWFALTGSDRFLTVVNLVALVLTTTVVVALAWSARAGRLRSFASLAVASIVTMLVYGAKFLDVMHHPPAGLILPDVVHRLAVAASYTLPIPALSALALVARQHALGNQPSAGRQAVGER